MRGLSVQPEEPRPGPVRAGDLARDGGERPPGLALPDEAGLGDIDDVGHAVPFADQPAAGLEGSGRPFRGRRAVPSAVSAAANVLRHSAGSPGLEFEGEESGAGRGG
jgi:hypothetical protein